MAPRAPAVAVEPPARLTRRRQEGRVGRQREHRRGGRSGEGVRSTVAAPLCGRELARATGARGVLGVRHHARAGPRRSTRMWSESSGSHVVAVEPPSHLLYQHWKNERVRMPVKI